ncbi:Hypothetical predicted protein [Mytilus galloprovincialis]|uniref:UMOD/GP2/OIT3-like D8C domain-containing protein n=1 Tax=Mytilus galloprovincialis TaxID=29158 RepID=A0A8B6H9G7_MYTGA|nr:Hypothetical predicted protein [Mytilus galloprovincialis]
MFRNSVKIFCFTIFYISTSTAANPCRDYVELDDWRRSVSNGDTYQLCDTFLVPGWYRVISQAGQEMPTECIRGGFRCGTTDTVWMNGTFPDAEEVKNVTACASDYNDNCCANSYDIQVKNCSGYYVYNLVPTKSCPQAYCFGYELPCPLGETSPTNFTPGCKYDACLKINHNEINDWRRSVANNNTLPAICDSFLKTGWYRPTSKAGQYMPTECPLNAFTCGTTHPIWMNGVFPESGETNNVIACSVGYTNDCCLNQYDIQVKNCSHFLLYNLKSTKNCPEAYCFGSELPCAEGEISENGFSPGCKIDPCHAVNYKVIKGQEKRTSNYTLQPDEDPIDDSHLPTSFYRFDSQTGNDIVNEEQAMFQCGTKFPIYMIGSIPNVTDQTVSRRFCMSGYNGSCEHESQIKIQNCGNFRVYFLKPSPLKDSGYCAGTLPIQTNQDKPVVPDAKKTIDDDDLPWIVTVAVLGLVCTILTGIILVKKLLAKTRVHEELPPPSYSSVNVNKPPILHDIHASIPQK